MCISIAINPCINPLLLKRNNKKFLVLYTKNYYTKYSLDYGINIHFNKHSRTLVLNIPSYYPCLKNLQGFVSNLNFSLVNYYCNKVKFTGKSYKIKKTKSYFMFEFNKSHVELIIWNNVFLKKLKKNKIFLKSVDLKEVKWGISRIENIRKVNPFTRRGLWKSRGFLKKKIGKKSS